MADSFKEYNEQIKAFETLARRESELLQKLAQSDAERDADAKIGWAEELVELQKLATALQKSRSALLVTMREAIERSSEKASTSEPAGGDPGNARGTAG